MNRRQLGTAAALAALALLASGTPLAGEYGAADGGVKCAGVNSCKGTSECKAAGHECKGQNSCKGQGWTTSKSEADCTAAGGKVVK